MNIISYSREVVKKVKDAFEENRKTAYSEAEQRKAEVHMRVEGIKEIDCELAQTGLRVYAEAINKSSSKPFDERIGNLKEKSLELQQTRAALLSAAGYPEDYTKVKFKCQKCDDTGYVGLDPCSCLIQALRREAYLSSGLGSVLANQSFENFNVSLYPDPSKKQMQFIFEASKRFADEFSCQDDGTEKNLIFYGNTGLGKTHLSTSIAKRLIDRGFYVVYDSIQNILHTFERERFSKIDDEASTTKYFDCDFLIIDDLGSEFANSFTHSVLYNLLNTRINASKGTLISTNIMGIEKLRRSYDERIVSRVIGSFRAMMFSGNDIRLLMRRDGRQ